MIPHALETALWLLTTWLRATWEELCAEVGAAVMECVMREEMHVEA